jgi:hypothetical protein
MKPWDNFVGSETPAQRVVPPISVLTSSCDYFSRQIESELDGVSLLLPRGPCFCKRGSVTHERRRQIAQSVIRGLGLAGI